MNFENLQGKTLLNIQKTEAGDGDNDILLFTTIEGEVFKMTHHQDCCESVSIESIVGDLNDLIGNPILMAEEATSNKTDDTQDRSETWTFYKLATQKGYVDVRWFGSSNGYYSEGVSFSQEPSLNKEDLIKLMIETKIEKHNQPVRFKF